MPEKSLEKIIKKIKNYNPQADIALIETAFEFAVKSHDGQVRKSGEHFIFHPLGTAEILADFHLDTSTIVASLLHDVVEDTKSSLKKIEKQFGQEVSFLIDGVTKLDKVKFISHEEEQVENYRKLLLAMAKDIRVILIKLADRLHNMRTVNFLHKEKQMAVAQETLDIYAPIAHRLGIYLLKEELEDLAFKVLYPRQYQKIEGMVLERRGEREKYLAKFLDAFRQKLKEATIKAEIHGRTKHYYSIYQKMIQRERPFSEIYDLIGVRVIVSSVKECYEVLGLVHSLFKPVPGLFKDYIALPKFNMYQSLHTTVFGPEGRPVEIQIRARKMHETAEYGIAAHWKYKEPEVSEKESIEYTKWLQEMLAWQSEAKNPQEFMGSLKIELFEEEVFVFTPKGKLLSLPRGSTPIDFAYSIHTDIGHHCVGAKVNNKIVPIDYQLKNGDIVEIITSKSSHGPSRDWLNIVHTSRARSRIKSWFSKEEREESLELGKLYLTKALRRRGIPLHKSLTHEMMKQITKSFNLENVEELYLLIGEEKVPAQQVAAKIFKELRASLAEDEITPEAMIPQVDYLPPKMEKETGIRVRGIEDILIKLARCCNPVPYDDIIGFVTQGQGVSVHRKKCANIKNLEDTGRLIDVEWDRSQLASYKVEIQVEALDRPNLVRDITTLLSEFKVNIFSANVTTNKENVAIIRLLFEIGDASLLNNILNNIKKIDSIYDAYRV